MDAARHPGSPAAIAAVATGFFVALDRFEDGRILELVADDVEWVRPGGAVRGRNQVRDVLAQRPRARVTRHLLSNVDVRMQTAESALVRYDVLVFDSGPPAAEGSAAPGQPVMVAGASVVLSGEDTLVLHGENWLIVRKQASPVFKFSP